MKTLVTGIAGFIGSHVAENLLLSGYEVVGIDDLSGGFIENIPLEAEFIEGNIIASLKEHGLQNVSVSRVLSPPWTTDWITPAGREKLRAYGIAPPEGSASKSALLGEAKSVSCPRCGTSKTSLVSEFGSTACKASWKCEECLEPFEYFKCI